MRYWKFRQKSRRDDAQQVDASMLQAMIRNQLVGNEHEYLPPQGAEWISLQQTLQLLQSPPSLPKQAALCAIDGQANRSPPATAPRGKSSVTGLALSESIAVQSFGRVHGSRRRRAQSPLDDEIDMTPMIDMTFLLLIFFMVTSSVGPPWRQISLPPATAGDTQDPENRVVLVLDFAKPPTNGELDAMTGSKFATLADARMYFAEPAGGSKDSSQEAIAPEALVDRLKEAFQAKPAAQFILLSHRKMPVGVVREVLKQSKAAGAKETLVGVSVPH